MPFENLDFLPSTRTVTWFVLAFPGAVRRTIAVAGFFEYKSTSFRVFPLIAMDTCPPRLPFLNQTVIERDEIFTVTVAPAVELTNT